MSDGGLLNDIYLGCLIIVLFCTVSYGWWEERVLASLAVDGKWMICIANQLLVMWTVEHPKSCFRLFL